jgi:hypothetical protein
MPHIVLTEEQVRILEQAAGPVEVRDTQGRPIAQATRFSPEDVEMIIRSRANQAAGGRRIPSAEVQAHLRKLEEIASREELDEARVLDILRRLRAGEEV